MMPKLAFEGVGHGNGRHAAPDNYYLRLRHCALLRGRIVRVNCEGTGQQFPELGWSALYIEAAHALDSLKYP